MTKWIGWSDGVFQIYHQHHLSNFRISTLELQFFFLAKVTTENMRHAHPLYPLIGLRDRVSEVCHRLSIIILVVLICIICMFSFNFRHPHNFHKVKAGKSRRNDAPRTDTHSAFIEQIDLYVSKDLNENTKCSDHFTFVKTKKNSVIFLRIYFIICHFLPLKI